MQINKTSVIIVSVVFAVLLLLGSAVVLGVALFKNAAPFPGPKPTLSIAALDTKAAQSLCEMEARSKEEKIWDELNTDANAFGYVLSTDFVMTGGPVGSAVSFKGLVTSEIRSGGVALPTSIDYSCTATLTAGKWSIDAQRT